ncbi:MAG: nicotinate phosphoribosyltransferase [Actinomycetes bacterium]
MGKPAPQVGSEVLLTDLYEVTMALAYLTEGMTDDATFSLFVREVPPDRGFLVAAGVESVLDYLSRLNVDDAVVAGFAAALGRSPGELAPLRGLRFTGDVWAIPEGRIALPDEPLLEITAPLPQAQLVETYVLNQISHQTALASKAARCVLAARGRPVVDFALRRCHGLDAGMHAARAGAVVGFAATSNVAASGRYGLPATGTMAHSFVEAFGAERDAFQVFVRNTRGPVTLLVDTYDTAHGVHLAAEILAAINDERPIGIRLDSGDLAELAVRARQILDGAGLKRARIVVSGGLDEYDIDALVATDAPVDVYAVGTRVGTSADAPYLDTAYKLVEYAGRPIMKLSPGKATTPGPKQVFRGRGLDDVIACRDEDTPPDAEPLLEAVMVAGQRVEAQLEPAEAVAAARQRFELDLATTPPASRRIRQPVVRRPRRSEALTRLTQQVRTALTQHASLD